MSTSKFCIQQRQQEQQRVKKLLLLGFAGSATLHAILASTISQWSFESPQAAEPMELILVDKPKPQPKIESKPIVEPEPKPIPRPVKAQTPPTPVKPPEPVEAQTAPPKPIPKKVLTNPTPTPSQPIVSAPIENTTQAPSLSNSFSASNNSVTSSQSSSSNNPAMPGAVVATNSAPPRPESSNTEGISCMSNCEPEYPAALEGVEGSAGVKLTIDPNGRVIGAELTAPDNNSGVNRQALLAARQMQFSSPPGGSTASVRVKIDFTVEGSEYDRAAREARERQERAEKERQEQEAAKQQELERERQASQEQLERERQARQQQVKPPATRPPQPQIPKPQTAPKPLPPPLQNEADDEMLQKFRERIESYQ